jgi:hypothetical protein
MGTAELMGKTKKYEKRWEDNDDINQRRDNEQRKQKRIKNALRSKNVQDLIDNEEDY